MNFLLKLRTNKAINNVSTIAVMEEHSSAEDQEIKQVIAQAVKNRLDDKYICQQQGNIIVTEMGFVTMALLSGQAIYKKDLLLIPGVDNANQFGYLVLRDGFVPFHSLAHNADDAALDAELAYQKAERLLGYYGNKKTLKIAAKAAPWYLLSKEEDVWEAGMCRWGAYSFSKRARINFLAHRIGVPRLLLRFAGAYGDRITAATLKRKATQIDTNKISTPKATPVSPLY